MMPTWEAVNAVATAISAIVVSVAVILGYRQLRVTAEQLHALRLGTQLDGTMRIFDDINDEEFRAARLFVANELIERMHDEHFRAGAALIGRAEEREHPELIVLRRFEKLGAYVKYGMLDGNLIYDYAGMWIVSSWDQSAKAGVIAMHREVLGETLWENFEWLAASSRAWMLSRGADPAQMGVFMQPSTDGGPPAVRQE